MSSELPNSAVETLEEFIFAMALHAVSIETLYELQRKALQSDYLEVDEMEQVETIGYEAKRIFHAIDALIHLMGERAEIDPSKIALNLKSKVSNVKKAKKPRAKKPS
jgi:hypothetical protein